MSYRDKPETTFAQDIEKEAERLGQSIAWAVIGEMGWSNYNEDDKPQDIPKGKCLVWPEARMYLDYLYDDGYGAPDCHSVYAWTADYVIAVYQYDGATGIYSIPRNPQHCIPDMAGG